jgi:ankyrin repeat protein
MENRLPRADAIIEWARAKAKPHEQLGRWEEAADAYFWLFRQANTFPGQDDITTKATALLVEYLRAVTNAIGLREAQRFEGDDILDLEELKTEILEELQRKGVNDVLRGIMGLYDMQCRSWECRLVENSSPPKGKDTVLKFTELHMAAQEGRQDVSTTMKTSNEMVNEKDILVNEKDILDWTPLHYAARKSSSQTVQGLLIKGADVNARDIRGQTPLHYAACRPDGASIIHNLLRKGAEINIRDVDGIAPLHNAAIHGGSDAMRSLIEAGAGIDAVDGLGCTPLHWAAFHRREDMVKVLEDANKKLRDHNGRTALHLAVVAEGDTPATESVVKALVGKNDDTEVKDIEVKDRYSRTPLHYTATRGYKTTVKYLIE